MIGVVVPPTMRKRIDAWALERGILRSEAIRRLVGKALDCKEKAAE
jgi:hypothetical protein